MRCRLSITAALAGAALFLPPVPVFAADAGTGRDLALDIGKGNCLACHAVPGDPKAVTSANIGPPLAQIRSRFPQRERLREQIRDPTQFNPDTVMPPFGKHGILTPAEIEKIIDYLYTL